MISVGHIKEIWRYPLKSAGGERLDRAVVGKLGIEHDRGWCLLDQQDEILSAKRIPKLLLLRARYLEVGGSMAMPPHLEIELPDGTLIESHQDWADRRLSDFLGRPVQLHRLSPGLSRQHFRRSQRLSKAGMRYLLGIKANAPLPDLGQIPLKLLMMTGRYVTLPGTYFDAAPLHLITTATLNQLSEALNRTIDPKRFRANIVIETPKEMLGAVEQAWVGQQLCIDSCSMQIFMATLRCSMPMQAQHEFGKDVEIAKFIAKMMNSNFGIYANPRSDCNISEGSQITMFETRRSIIGRYFSKVKSYLINSIVN